MNHENRADNRLAASLTATFTSGARGDGDVVIGGAPTDDEFAGLAQELDPDAEQATHASVSVERSISRRDGRERSPRPRVRQQAPWRVEGA